MRKRLREICARELARAERLIKAWPSPPPIDIYVHQGERNVYGHPIPTRIEREPAGPIGAQLKEFWGRVALGRAPELRFADPIYPEDIVHIVTLEDDDDPEILFN